MTDRLRVCIEHLSFFNSKGYDVYASSCDAKSFVLF